jgi:hypothetical protein
MTEDDELETICKEVVPRILRYCFIICVRVTMQNHENLTELRDWVARLVSRSSDMSVLG